MTMLDRRDRSTDADAGPEPGPDVGADEETVRLAHKDFRRRRFAGRRRRNRTRVLLLLLVAALGSSVWLVFFSSHVTAQDVEVTGNARVGGARIERTAEVPIGTPLARVDLEAIRARVESIAAVREAEVSRGWPRMVRIEVTERTPVAVIDRGDGLQALDAEGVLFSSYVRRPSGLPLVRTDAGTRDEALAEVGRVITALPSTVAVNLDVVEVATVDQIKLVLDDGPRVVWGSAEDSVQKAEVLAVLLRRAGTGVREIDVSVPGRPTTR